MNIDDLANALKGAAITIDTVNIQIGTGNEFYAAPVQVNQASEPALEPEHYCHLCGFSGDDLDRNAYGEYSHAECRRKAAEEVRRADDERRRAEANARRSKFAVEYAAQAVVFEQEPARAPDPVVEFVAPVVVRQSYFEEIEKRYADSYAELIANGIEYGQEESAWVESWSLT